MENKMEGLFKTGIYETEQRSKVLRDNGFSPDPDWGGNFNYNYGYEADPRGATELEVKSLETSGYIRIPYKDVKFEEGTIKFPFDGYTYLVAKPTNTEIITKPSTPYILRKSLVEGLLAAGFEKEEDEEIKHFTKDGLTVTVYYGCAEVTDGNVKISCPLQSIICTKEYLVMSVAGTVILETF